MVGEEYDSVEKPRMRHWSRNIVFKTAAPRNTICGASVKSWCNIGSGDYLSLESLVLKKYILDLDYP
jgi:hypothetical protein